jgi:hypothetical protein
MLSFRRYVAFTFESAESTPPISPLPVVFGAAVGSFTVWIASTSAPSKSIPAFPL